MASRSEGQRCRVLEVAVQQLPTSYRRDVRVLLYALKERGYGVRGSKVGLERALEVVNKAVAAINILEGN
jgi:hypothetical protein